MSLRRLTLLKPLAGIFFLLAAIIYPFFLFDSILTAILAALLSVLLIEIVFRIAFRIRNRRGYSFIPKVPFKKMYIEPHPYLPYVYKKNFITQKTQPANYPLHKDAGYLFVQVRTNDFRHIDDIDGRDITVPKPEGRFRILCLGGSVTGNNLVHEGTWYSYPLVLEKVLKDRFPHRNIEVNNCGMGGFTTADILVKFLLNTFDTEPDMVVLYHAYNDLPVSLTAGFESDHSHARRNLGETYYLYRIASKFPNIPLAVYNFSVNQLFSQNIRYTLLSSVAKGKPDIKNEFMGLGTYRRNIEHLINVCKGNGIQVVLSTYCYFLYDDIKDDPVHLKYREGVARENDVMHELARKHGLPLVDNDRLVPREESYFVDSVHLTPEGMSLIARNIAAPIIGYLENQEQG